MLSQRQTFKKEERISAKKEIDLLFDKGLSFSAYPLRIIYTEKDFSETPSSILISVPKKRTKLAVNRNRIKRLIRESYRLNKADLVQFLNTNNKGVMIAFIFIGNNLPSHSDIEPAMIKALKLLQDKLS
ncbi:ribonuclease P protein component [Dysgonomonadaceae bacterium PH5-43]|nr:ribonuclease P protein component [Dysgonomonadaceae bacterium PH5-43]